MYGKQSTGSVLCKSNKSSESKTSCYASSITARGFPYLQPCLTPLRSKEATASNLYIIFPSSQPWGWISKSQLDSWASVSTRATLETHQCHFSVTHQGLLRRCSQSQTPAKIRVLPLSHALCPAPGRINQGSGNWVLPHASTVMSSVGSGGDTYYRLMVPLYRSKAALRVLLRSLES